MSPDDVIALLLERDEPVTGKEVGDMLGISNRSELDKLNELHDLLNRGERIGARDVLIVGTAVGSPDPRVLTRNVGEFEWINGLEVESY